MWRQMSKLEKQKREINVLTQKAMAKKKKKQQKTQADFADRIYLELK